MIYILRQGEGEYDSYAEVTVAVFRGPKGHTLDSLREEFVKKVAIPANAKYQKIRKKGMPRHLSMGINDFVAWLEKKGFKKVDYSESCCY